MNVGNHHEEACRISGATIHIIVMIVLIISNTSTVTIPITVIINVGTRASFRITYGQMKNPGKL